MAGFESDNSPYRYNYEQPAGSSKVQITNLVARVATSICVLVAIVILQTNQVTLKNGVTITFNYSSIFLSYKYIFYVAVVGLAYTLLQIPFAVCCVRYKKRLIEHWCCLQMDFYCDKIVSLLLGVAVGAAFGGNIDLNFTSQPCNGTNIPQLFGRRGNVVAGFVLAGCLCSAISSIFSSWAVAMDV